MYALLETSKFDIVQEDSHADSWCLGADLAGWLCSKLIRKDRFLYRLGPTMEDWGWTLSFEINKVTCLLNIWAPVDSENVWVIQVVNKPSLLSRLSKEQIEEALVQMRGALEEIGKQYPGIDDLQWSEIHPLDKV
jgi:hypothetical protein